MGEVELPKMFQLDDVTEREVWMAYDNFKKQLPHEMDWLEREKAIREYCDHEGI